MAIAFILKSGSSLGTEKSGAPMGSEDSRAPGFRGLRVLGLRVKGLGLGIRV